MGEIRWSPPILRRRKFSAVIFWRGKRKQARSVGERACYDERGSSSLIHSPMDEEEWDYFFISSFFMASCAIASSFFMASCAIASSFFMASCAIASSFFMASLDIVSLVILSCANATGADTAPNDTMRADARSKTREELFMVYILSRLVWNDVCRQTKYAVDRRAVTTLAKLPWWKGPGSISSGVNATNRAHTPKGVKTLAEIWQGLRRQDALPVDDGGRRERRAHRRSCAAGSWPRQQAQRGNDIFRRQATAVIDIDISEGDAAILCDDERRRQRQFPALIAVDTGERLAVQPHRRTQFLWQRIDQTEAAPDHVAGVAQDIKFERVRFSHRQRPVRKLRRDRDDPPAERGDLRQRALVGAKLNIAIRTPATSVEGHH